MRNFRNERYAYGKADRLRNQKEHIINAETDMKTFLSLVNELAT